MSAPPPQQSRGAIGRTILMRVISGSLFSMMMSLLLFTTIVLLKVNVSSLGVFDLAFMISIMFWSATLFVWLVGRLPLYIIVIVAGVLLTLDAVSFYAFITTHLVH